jgi:hypothetical protein
MMTSTFSKIIFVVVGIALQQLGSYAHAAEAPFSPVAFQELCAKYFEGRCFKNRLKAADQNTEPLSGAWQNLVNSDREPLLNFYQRAQTYLVSQKQNCLETNRSSSVLLKQVGSDLCLAREAADFANIELWNCRIKAARARNSEREANKMVTPKQQTLNQKIAALPKDMNLPAIDHFHCAKQARIYGALADLEWAINACAASGRIKNDEFVNNDYTFCVTPKSNPSLLDQLKRFKKSWESSQFFSRRDEDAEIFEKYGNCFKQPKCKSEAIDIYATGCQFTFENQQGVQPSGDQLENCKKHFYFANQRPLVQFVNKQVGPKIDLTERALDKSVNSSVDSTLEKSLPIDRTTDAGSGNQ